ncbi:protein of unknown function [Ruminococcaceae bacterium BL-6]|nr:protein of unknown function [Ruminococcaceae bacterium BL-6]
MTCFFASCPVEKAGRIGKKPLVIVARDRCGESRGLRRFPMRLAYVCGFPAEPGLQKDR